MPEHPPNSYEAVLSSGASAFLVEQPKQVQRLLLSLIERLANQSAHFGDYSFADSTGRALQVTRVGRFSFTYWADDPVKELRIVEISIL
jgi:hypothetical protein